MTPGACHGTERLKEGSSLGRGQVLPIPRPIVDERRGGLGVGYDLWHGVQILVDGMNGIPHSVHHIAILASPAWHGCAEDARGEVGTWSHSRSAATRSVERLSRATKGMVNFQREYRIDTRQLPSAATSSRSKRCSRWYAKDNSGTMKRPPSAEIDFVASLVENGAPFLESEWQKVLSPNKIAIRVAGVFCHQSPMVDIKGMPPYPVPTRRCELADLLVLHSHSRSTGKVFWRGVLMQTKLHSRQNVVPDEPQLWLYERWPSFAIAAPYFHRWQRDFDQDQRSGMFALVSNNGWYVQRASNSLSAQAIGSLDFGEFLVEMLYDMDPAQAGRSSMHGRQVYQNSKKDWSPTIWELVKITAAKALRHRGKKRGLYDRDLSRIGGGVMQMMSDVASRDFIVPPGRDVREGPDDGDGISILVIETRSELDVR